MSNAQIDTRLLDKALYFAIDAHAGTERRGKGFPYIVHPMEAVEIVASITADQELLAAAALHDTVEDTGTSIDDIRREFGDRIADIVAAETDSREDGKAGWIERKQAALERLRKADMDVKTVAMGDKLSNMRAIARDAEVLGDELWKRFHAPNGKSDHEWRYRALAEVLSDLADTDAYREFVSLIDRTFGKK